MWNAIGSKAQKVAQGMSSAVAEIQKDLQKEHRSRGGDGGSFYEFDEAEAYKQMLVGFQMDQAKLGKEIQAALREKEDEAAHWKKLLDMEKGGGGGGASGAGGGDGHTNGDGGGGALGVDDGVKLRAEVDVLTAVNLEWEDKLKDALEKSTEEAALRMKLEHETATLNARVKELDTARAASEDLILSLSAEKSKMLGSSGEASDTIDDLVDEYSRLASEHTAQRQMDAETIQRLENVRDELVEKLKSHERNILKLLARGEEDGLVSHEMTERNLVGQAGAREVSSAAASTATEAADKSWTTAEVEKKLGEQAAELRAEKEDALDELRQALKLESAAALKRGNASALALAAEGHAAAMKRAAGESASAAETRAAAAVEAALTSAGRAAQKKRREAVELLSKAKDKEREAALGEARREAEEAKARELAKLREDAEAEGKGALAAAATAQAAALSAAVAEAEKRLTVEVEAVETTRDEALKSLQDTKANLSKQSDEALLEQRKRLEVDAEEKIQALRKEMGEEVAAAKTARDEANALYAKENRGRKAIHNKLMDIQGNIRVLARVRPMLEVELKSGKDLDVTAFPADEDIVIKKPKEDKGGSGGRGGLGSKEESTETRFEFDQVFRPDSSQDGVFKAVGPLVTSVLDGYNVCIFAYGQTGSGKTFTMEGPDSNPGVNTRAITDLFRTAEARSVDVKYTFHMSMMEIYNEAVYDLLGTPEKDSRSPNGALKKGLDIRQNAAGGTSVPGLTEIEVSAMSEVAAQLRRGGKNRAVGAHDMNERSSRSHMIFNVRVEGANLHTGAVVKAKLNLIDLAGSERISKTDATGDRLREAQNINRSLSALGDVIAALATGKGHVPFRNSKLTFVLQDALSGNSKVMMFVNVSPASYNVAETLCSLNFAARCRSIKLGAASKNHEAPEVAKYRRVCETLHAQLVANGLVPSVSAGADSSSSSGGGSGSNPSPSKNASSVSTPGMGGRRKSHGSGVRGGDAGLGDTGGSSSASSSRTSSPPGSVKGSK